jgi:hypothetical protein
MLLEVFSACLLFPLVKEKVSGALSGAKKPV